VAYRDSTGLKFVFGDHLGSSTRTADISGGSAERQLYKAWGETRSSGTVGTKYQYTGQYSYTTDFGLHFYRSRWFDSYLSRWIQPDSLVPNIQNSNDWDRYQYGFGNPLTYVDPSGHDNLAARCLLKNDDGICVKWEHDRVGYTKINLSELSTESGITDISGKDFYNWYLYLYFTMGWWWDLFGQGGSFTIWDAFAVVFVHELDGHWTEPLAGEAAIRDANSWCIYLKGGSCTTANYVNWFAAEYQSGGHLVKGGLPPTTFLAKLGNHKGGAGALRNISALFANHPSDWDFGCVWNRPCSWANQSMITNEAELANVTNNPLQHYVYVTSGDPWILFSYCTFYIVLGKGNIHKPNYQCPNVR
jgi:RHS repeat-associated protein